MIVISFITTLNSCKAFTLKYYINWNYRTMNNEEISNLELILFSTTHIKAVLLTLILGNKELFKISLKANSQVYSWV